LPFAGGGTSRISIIDPPKGGNAPTVLTGIYLINDKASEHFIAGFTLEGVFLYHLK